MAMEAQIQTNAGIQYLQCMPKDVSTDFSDLSNTYFLADSLVAFDKDKGEGLLQWKRYRLSPRQAFNLNGYWPVRMQMLDFPDAAYDNAPALRMSITFLSPRTARIRLLTTPVVPKESDADDPMLAFSPNLSTKAGGVKTTETDNAVCYQSAYGTIEVQRFPFRLVLKDAKGKILTQTRHLIDNDSTQVKLLPFSFIKRGSDNSRSVNPVFLLSPG
jgi:alpha-D-xyloside xylohydrolase